jgi:hypothetical protein
VPVEFAPRVGHHCSAAEAAVGNFVVFVVVVALHIFGFAPRAAAVLPLFGACVPAVFYLGLCKFS